MSKKSKTIKYSIGFLFLAILSYSMSYVLISFIKNRLKFVFQKELLLDKAVLVLFAILLIVFTVIFLSVLIKYKMIGYTKMISSTTKLDSKLYGSSAWQSQKEMNKNYSLFPWKLVPMSPDAQGFVVASRKRKDGSIEINRVAKAHTLALATTQVGKTKYFLSPNIQYLASCYNKPSMFITDPKGELYADNSAYLKARGYNVFTYNLDEPSKSDRYNPLSIVWDFYYKYKETSDTSYLDDAEALLREVASTVAPVVGTDPTWDIGAQNIIQGVCLALLEDSLTPEYNITKEKFTLWQVLNILTQGTDSLRDFALRRPKTSLARQRLMQYVDNNAKETLGSFMVTTTNKLNQYVDTGMTLVMSETELNLDEISAKPYAIFCIVPDSNTARHPLAVLFASQIYKYLIHIAKQTAKEKPEIGQKLPNEFYFLLEEFGNFPKMDCIEQMLSIGGGRKIWTCIILQSLSQLKKVYGKETAETIMNNLKLQIYLGVTENETNKYYSEFFGSSTVKKNSVQLSSADLDKDIAGNTGAEKQMLIHSDELTRLKPGEILFKMFGHQPCRSSLVPIFDKELQENGTFTVGSIAKEPRKNTLDNEKLYFDLTERDNIFDIIQQKKTALQNQTQEETVIIEEDFIEEVDEVVAEPTIPNEEPPAVDVLGFLKKKGGKQ